MRAATSVPYNERVRPCSRGRENLKRTLTLCLMAFFLAPMAAGMSAVWIMSHHKLDEPVERLVEPDTPDTPRSTDTSPELPATDAPGDDVAGLPPFPGSVRLAYEWKVRDGLAVAEARYLSEAGIQPVREHFREVFRSNGWTVSNLDFSSEKRSFFVVDGDREAYVDIIARGDSLTETSIEMTCPEAPPEPEEPEPRRDEPRTEDAPPKDALPETAEEEAAPPAPTPPQTPAGPPDSIPPSAGTPSQTPPPYAGPPTNSGAPPSAGPPPNAGPPSWSGAPPSAGPPSNAGPPAESGAPSGAGPPPNSGPPSGSGAPSGAGPPGAGVP